MNDETTPPTDEQQPISPGANAPTEGAPTQTEAVASPTATDEAPKPEASNSPPPPEAPPRPEDPVAPPTPPAEPFAPTPPAEVPPQAQTPDVVHAAEVALGADDSHSTSTAMQPTGSIAENSRSSIPSPIPAPVVVRTASVGDAMTENERLFEQAMAELDGTAEVTTDSTFKKLFKGDRIEATVIQVEKDRVFVDLGTKSEGVIPLAELSDNNLETAVGAINIGDKVQVIVLRPEGGEGNAIVSKRRADFEDRWLEIEEKFKTQESIKAPVIDRVKGGLVVDIGVRGFVPATHVGNGKLRNIEKYLGQTIDLKIIEIDRERKKVVLSNRQAEEERREEVKQNLFLRVKAGEILEGTVRRLTDYGAFVDLGGIDGLLHISEMSWMRINHPREVLKEGQKINVMVLRLDPGTSKISLGLRQVLPDPWHLIKENYKIGQKVNVTIGRLVQNGAFVKLPEGAEAFMPVSEMANRRINKPQDVLTENQEVEATIIDLRPDERRMVLSIKTGGSDFGGQQQQGYGYGAPVGYGGNEMEEGGKKGGGPRGGGGKGPKKGGRGSGGGRRDDDFEDGPIVGRVPTGGATIGERLGILKGFITRGDDEDVEDVAEPDKKEEGEEE